MPQQTNLNVAPYFDDFNPSDDFHKVLFKPGYPVQARELTTLQSILQNQVEKFGKHFFKEGAKIIPGNYTYESQYTGVQLINSFQGVPLSAYSNQLIGTQITGLSSGVTAYVKNVVSSVDATDENIILYVNYISSSSQDNSESLFTDGENLSCNTDINSGLLGNSSIIAGSPLATVKDSRSSVTGTAFSIQEGVYFIHGNFVNVADETLILDQDSVTSNYRIGLNVQEEIITSDLDETLNDNSQGYNNFAAPGADRLKITCSLFKKPLDDFDDDNFVELATVKDGILRAPGKTSGSPFQEILTNNLATRTYEQCGDYTLDDFNVAPKESLNDNQGNDGLYDRVEFTAEGDVPSEDKFVYKISPGKAVIKGFEVNKVRPTLVDATKPRSSFQVQNEAIIYETGPTLKLNRVYGTPGISTAFDTIVSLRDSRVGASNTDIGGNEIGLARLYDFRLESGSYNTVSNLNEWEIALYDVQTTTSLTVNQPLTQSVPTYIKGANSGATGFLFKSVTDNATIEIYETSGEFIKNEPLVFNGIAAGNIAIAITSHSISDVKSVFSTRDVGATPYAGMVGLSSIFNADVVQEVQTSVGIATISGASGGISTVTSPNERFPGTLVKVNNLVQFSNPDSSNDPTYGKVTSVGTDIITITNVTNLPGLVNGSLPTTNKEVTDFKILTTDLAESGDNTLYTPLPHRDISNVDLNDARLTIRKRYTVSITSGKTDEINAGENETFLPFDDERYSLIRVDGTTEVLTTDKFIYTNGSKTLQIANLGSNTTQATIVATLTKRKPKAKVKIRDRVNSIIVNKSKLSGSGIGSTTRDNGLEYGNYPYGTRVEDEIISLNAPDVIELHGVFESTTTSDPSAPKATLSSIISASTTTAEYIIGEKITGQTTGAVAVVAEKPTDSKIVFIYKNDASFEDGETIISAESKVTAIIDSIEDLSIDRTSDYKFSTGQEETFYDYGFISRYAGDAPDKKIKVYFLSAYYNTSDNGDITTVNSYDTFKYGKEIPVFNGIRNSDIIDIRPRVNDYTVAEGTRSPLEFLGRTFNGSGNSASNILASDEDILTTFSYYLGRVDIICLTKQGEVRLIEGTPAEEPKPPEPIAESIIVATIQLQPYCDNVAQETSVKLEEYKRYTMEEIGRLDRRIQNLEYYTSLSLLETNTANFFVSDADGLNRFKSGFFVDNFETFLPQDLGYIKNSIDKNNKELRPSHYTTSVDLMFGPVINVSPNIDRSTSAIDGINIRNNDGIITLDYAEVEWLKQEFATRSVSVTPFVLPFWNGVLFLTPQSDTWVDTVRLEARTIVEGNFAETVARARDILGFDPQIGFANTVWNGWNTIRVGATWEDTTNRTFVSRRGANFREWRTEEVARIIQQETQERTGTRVLVTESVNDVSLGSRVVNRDLITFVRSRNVAFVSQGIKPLTRMYAFFDGREVSRFCVPKLLQISMSSGAFQIGETVIGTMSNSSRDRQDSVPYIQFRVASPAHREGSFNTPVRTYKENPYTEQSISTTYTSNSDLLNVDIQSLSDITQTDYFGWVSNGMTLRGQTSGAIATISDVKLIGSLEGALNGSFFIPNPNNNTFPSFETGTNLFRLSSDASNSVDALSSAEQDYTTSGVLETVQEDILSTRNATIRVDEVSGGREFSRWIDTRVTTLSTRTETWGGSDPLAQSFQITNPAGVFLTRCDVFFRTKDDMNIPVEFSIRTMSNGLPTQNIVPMSEVVLDPDDVTLTTNASESTSFQFRAPVYLEGGKEYCIVMLSQSAKYSVYISRVGETDVLNQTYVANQPYLGSLFKSQNAGTWEPSQWEDLKFTLYRADFLEAGTVDLYNPTIGVDHSQHPRLVPNSLDFTSKEIRVGLSKTVGDEGLLIGNTILQGATQATADYVGSAGTVTSIDITNVGLGYTPGTGQHTFSGVNLVTLTGSGRNATADITINNGSIVSSGATIVNGGDGYVIGDVIGISTIGSNSIGRNAKLSVVSIGSTDELILNNVQGNFIVGSANTLSYINNSGITTTLDDANGGNVQISEIVTVSDGLHVKVNHKNHGMYSTNNIAKISGAVSDVSPTKLTTALQSGNETQISVQDATQFTNFEGVGVGTTNIGYAMVGSELISYTNVSGNVLGNVSRNVGLDGSDSPAGLTGLPHPVGVEVSKYELDGVNLMRINKTHNLADATVDNAITFDSYNIKLNMATKFNTNNDDRSNNVGYPQLQIGKTKSAGGYKIKASQNIPFEIITPSVQHITLPNTNILADVRTVSGTSLSGNETSFIDAGFESIFINQTNYLSTPRLIASKVNADASLDNLPGNKSLDMKFTLTSSDSWVSPVLDGERISTILTSNRVDSRITDYTTDNQVKTLNDPTACQYISKEMELENPASSLKILLNAHMNVNTDIRAFYALNIQPNQDPVFVPFPGYTNLTNNGEVIDASKNDGRPDKFVSKSNDYGQDSQNLKFLEYSFTANQVPSFRYYRIKLILTSTNQVHVPLVRQLRVMALA